GQLKAATDRNTVSIEKYSAEIGQLKAATETHSGAIEQLKAATEQNTSAIERNSFDIKKSSSDAKEMITQLSQDLITRFERMERNIELLRRR
ncbi:hypothetical protein, partial [Dyadobacter crusticola]|uniref:hypothetical protein n=1 Tax=Dyadobacter crusticola TaxID=292407 RepID=UPI000552D953